MSKTTRRSSKSAPRPRLDVRNFEGRIIDCDAMPLEERRALYDNGGAVWMTLIAADGSYIDAFVRSAAVPS